MFRVALVAFALLFSCTQGQLIGHSCSISCPGKSVPGGTQGCNCNGLEDELGSVRFSLHRLTSIVLAEWSKASNGRWYRMFRKSETFQRAREICKQHGAHLASSGMQNLADIREIIKLVGLRNNEQTWIGLSDLVEEGTWIWEDGSSGSVVNWTSGQPDNHRGKEHCVHFWSNFQFNDSVCDVEKNFLCETDMF